MNFSTSALLVLALVGPAGAGQQVALESLPAGVHAAVQREKAAGAEIRRVGAEKENGKTVYEIETMRRGHSRDLVVDATGQVIEVEEDVEIDAVPAPVKAALGALGKVSKVEMVTKGASVTYEAQIEKNGKRSEVVVNAAGARVKG